MIISKNTNELLRKMIPALPMIHLSAQEKENASCHGHDVWANKAECELRVCAIANQNHDYQTGAYAALRGIMAFGQAI